MPPTPTPPLPPGSTDPTFITTGFTAQISTDAVAPDGGLLGLGMGTNPASGQTEFVLERLTRDGGPDRSFGANGRTSLSPLEASAAQQVLVQADGKVLALLYGSQPIAPYQSGAVAVVRLLASGQPDAGFGSVLFGQSGAVAFTNPFSHMAVQVDGKILLVGASGPSVLIRRLLTNGQVDPSFGQNGTTTVTLPNYDLADARTVLVVPGDNIVVGGSATRTGPGGHTDNLELHLTPDGAPDANYGGPSGTLTFGGRPATVITSLLPFGATMLVYAAQTITTTVDSCLLESHSTNFRVGVFSSFGTPTLAEQTDGKILLGGCGPRSAPGAASTPAVLRLNPDGKPDTTFGMNGAAAVPDSDHLLIQPGGKIVSGLHPMSRLNP